MNLVRIGELLETLEEHYMQLALNFGQTFTQQPTANRLISISKAEQSDLYQDCLINLEGLDFQSKYRCLKHYFQSLKSTTKKEVKATFFFKEETKIELSHYLRGVQAHWVTEATLKLTMVSDDLWVAKLKSKRAGRSLYDFPLHCVTQVKLEAIEKTTSEVQQLHQIWKRKHEKVWTNLTLEEVAYYLDIVEILDLTQYFTQDDLEYAHGCFIFEEPVSLEARTKFQIIQLKAEIGKDGQYRTWALVINTRTRRIRRYLWLTPVSGLYFREEKY